jgi:hypothetical protein
VLVEPVFNRDTDSVVQGLQRVEIVDDVAIERVEALAGGLDRGSEIEGCAFEVGQKQGELLDAVIALSLWDR